MDILMLASAQLSLSALDLRRLAAAQLLFSGATCIRLAAGQGNWLHLPLLLLCAAIATGERRVGRILEAACVMFCTGAAAAGAFLLGGGLPSAFAGGCACIFLLRRHRHLARRWNVELQIEKQGCGVSVPALIDTGNRLRERQSGLPVLIVESEAVPELHRLMHALPPDELRSLPYGVLGSGGEISCFRPDRVQILLAGQAPIPAPPCCVAIFDGSIPGRTCALAPPEFADAADRRFPKMHVNPNEGKGVRPWRFQA